MPSLPERNSISQNRFNNRSHSQISTGNSNTQQVVVKNMNNLDDKNTRDDIYESNGIMNRRQE